MNFSYMLPTISTSWKDFIHPYNYKKYLVNDKLDWKELEESLDIYVENEIQKSLDEILIEENKDNILLGEGTYGKVYDMKNGLVKKTVRETAFEIIIGKNILHPNIISFVDVKYDSRYFIDIYYKKIKTTIDYIIPNARHIKQLIHTVLALNKAGYFHTDIKPSNILYENNNIYLADLGGCVPIAHSKNAYVGATYYYAAPEVNINDSFNQKSQVWSIILSFIDLLMGDKIKFMLIEKPAFNKKIYNQLLETIKQLKFDNLKKVYNYSDCIIECYQNFIEFCMVYDYNLRPNLQDILLHPLMLHIDEKYTELIIQISDYKFNDRKHCLNELADLTELSFYSLSLFLHIYHSTTHSSTYIIDYIANIIPGDLAEINVYGKICSDVIGHLLYYSIRDESHFISFMKEYKKNSSVYITLKPVPNPYRKIGDINVTEFLL